MTQRRALITGASEGIGRAFSTRLAAEGWTITGVARNASRLASLKSELSGPDHQTLVADLATPSGISAVEEALRSAPYDLLVNNAGFGVFSPFHAADPAAITKMLALNIDALVRLSYAYLGTARRGDALVNVSSMLAFLPMPGFAAYAATKAFVTSFTESLWVEQRRRGVYVVGLHPGATATEFHDRSGGAAKPPKAVTETPEQVVETAMRALARRRRPTVVSGTLNQVGTLLARVLTRRALVATMGRARP